MVLIYAKNPDPSSHIWKVMSEVQIRLGNATNNYHNFVVTKSLVHIKGEFTIFEEL